MNCPYHLILACVIIQLYFCSNQFLLFNKFARDEKANTISVMYYNRTYTFSSPVVFRNSKRVLKFNEKYGILVTECQWKLHVFENNSWAQNWFYFGTKIHFQKVLSLSKVWKCQYIILVWYFETKVDLPRWPPNWVRDLKCRPVDSCVYFYDRLQELWVIPYCHSILKVLLSNFSLKKYVYISYGTT